MADAGSFARRLGASWRALEGEQRTAAAASAALFVTMFLPWYSQTVVGNNPRGGRQTPDNASLTAWGAFSFVEAAVLLVAIGVLWMLFARGQGKAFHLPGGDGNVIFAAGLWVCLLVFYRQFDKPLPEAGASVAVTVGVSWGIFVTFVAGLFLAFSGQRLRSAHLAEPPLPGSVAPSDAPLPRGRRRPAAAQRPPERRPRPERQDSQTVADSRRTSSDETLVADVPEYSGSRPTPVDEPPTTRVPAAPSLSPEPLDAPTRAQRREEQLRLDEGPPTEVDRQLRFDEE